MAMFGAGRHPRIEPRSDLPCLMLFDDMEALLLSYGFDRSLAVALQQISSFADHSLTCAVAVPGTEGAPVNDVIAGIRCVWQALRRVLRPDGATLLVFHNQCRGGSVQELAWRVAFALQNDRWILRNALIGSAVSREAVDGIAFLFVSQVRYHFDADAVRAKYGRNPGDVVLTSGDSVVDRFLSAIQPHSHLVANIFRVGEPA